MCTYTLAFYSFLNASLLKMTPPRGPKGDPSPVGPRRTPPLGPGPPGGINKLCNSDSNLTQFQKYLTHLTQSEAQYFQLRTRSRRLSPFAGLFGDRVTGLEAIPCRSRRLLPFPGLFGDRMTRLRAIPHQI